MALPLRQIGAVVHHHVVEIGGQLALGVGRQLHVHVEGVALGGHEQRFVQAGDVARRFAEVDCRRRADAFGDDLHLYAELAAGIGFLVAHVFPAQGFLQNLKMEVDVYAASHHHQLGFIIVFFFPIGHAGFGLQGGLVVYLGGEAGLYHRRRIGQGRLGVALELGLTEAEVGPLVV